MVILQWTAQTECYHQACLPTVEDRTPTQDTTSDLLLGTINGTGIRIAGPGNSHTPVDITVTVTITHIGAVPGHTTDATTEALYNIATPAPTIFAMTHHTKDHLHIKVC